MKVPVDELKRQSKKFVELREKAIKKLGSEWPLAKVVKKKPAVIKRWKQLSVLYFKSNYRMVRSTYNESDAFDMAKSCGFHFMMIGFYFEV